jgi:hypothetical protein
VAKPSACKALRTKEAVFRSSSTIKTRILLSIWRRLRLATGYISSHARITEQIKITITARERAKAFNDNIVRENSCIKSKEQITFCQVPAICRHHIGQQLCAMRKMHA